MAFDVTDRADLARGDALQHGLIGRCVTPVEADVQRDPGRTAGGDRALGLPAGQRERLLDEDVFTRLRRGLDLRSMLGVRRGEHHRIDRGIAQHRGVIRGEREAEALLQIGAPGRIAGDRCRERELAALALHRLDETRAPMSRSANGRAQHAIISLRSSEQEGEGHVNRRLGTEKKACRSFRTGAAQMPELAIGSLKALRTAEAACTRCPLYSTPRRSCLAKVLRVRR